VPLILFVKGSTKVARNAAHKHNVSGAHCEALKPGETKCAVPCDHEAAVARWYAAPSKTKTGRGYPPGTLLFYSSQCDAGMAGSRKRRRKRR
jgi:hypothetical protein